MKVYICEVNRKLDNAERTRLKTIVHDNGLEYYARFNSRAAAEKYAAKVYAGCKVKLEIGEAMSAMSPF